MITTDLNFPEFIRLKEENILEYKNFIEKDEKFDPKKAIEDAQKIISKNHYAKDFISKSLKKIKLRMEKMNENPDNEGSNANSSYYRWGFESVSYKDYSNLGEYPPHAFKEVVEFYAEGLRDAHLKAFLEQRANSSEIVTMDYLSDQIKAANKFKFFIDCFKDKNDYKEIVKILLSKSLIEKDEAIITDLNWIGKPPAKIKASLVIALLYVLKQKGYIWKEVSASDYASAFEKTFKSNLKVDTLRKYADNISCKEFYEIIPDRDKLI